jgi:hypothetical protein
MSMMSMTFFTSTSTPLYSPSWAPSSTGSYAGTCIFLIIFALTFRILLVIKARQEAAWLDAKFNRRYVTVAGRLPAAQRLPQEPEAKRMVLSANGVEEDVVVVRKRGAPAHPWRITTDPLRAVMDTIIAGVAYLL